MHAHHDHGVGQATQDRVVAASSAGGAVTRMVPADDGSCRTRFLLGAYVLGGLSDREEAAVEAHLSYCAGCQAEYEELACVPELLDLLLPLDPPGA